MLDTDQRLNEETAAAETYIRSTFGLGLGLEPIAPTGLPHFMLDRYRFWRGSLSGQPMILVAWKGGQLGMGETANFLKQRDVLRDRLGIKLVVLLLNHVPAAVRQQLIRRRVAFLMPGAQLYIPEALLDLRERSLRSASEPREQITPTAQMVLLAVLLGQELEDANLTELAERFDVSIMSMSRTLAELQVLQVATSRQVGRQRRLHLLLEGDALWSRVKDRLGSPVRKVRTIPANLDDEVAPRAGESALANYTMLAPPPVERRAIAAARWKEVERQVHQSVAAGLELHQTELETWSYDPKALARGGVVDPLSLYLSTRHDPDERIAQAAEQLLEPFGW